MTKEFSTPATSKILIADDNQQNCELLEVYLSDEKYEIVVASDGEETLRKVAEFDPDLILLDIMMPKLSGYEVCQQLKQQKETRDIPILMVTTRSVREDILAAVEAGVNNYILKPFTPPVLKEKIDQVLSVAAGAAA